MHISLPHKRNERKGRDTNNSPFGLLSCSLLLFFFYNRCLPSLLLSLWRCTEKGIKNEESSAGDVATKRSRERERKIRSEKFLYIEIHPVNSSVFLEYDAFREAMRYQKSTMKRGFILVAA